MKETKSHYIEFNKDDIIELLVENCSSIPAGAEFSILDFSFEPEGNQLKGYLAISILEPAVRHRKGKAK